MPACDDAVVLGGCLHDLAAFPHVVGDGLLHVHVLARLAGPDGHQRVPVVGCRDGHRIHVLALEQRADIHVLRHLDARGRQLLGPTVQDGVVDVAERHHPHAGDLPEHLEVVIAFAAHANHRHPDGIVGTQRGGRCGPREEAGGRDAAGNTVDHETAAADRVRHARVLPASGIVRQRYRPRRAVSSSRCPFQMPPRLSSPRGWGWPVGRNGSDEGLTMSALAPCSQLLDDSQYPAPGRPRVMGRAASNLATLSVCLVMGCAAVARAETGYDAVAPLPAIEDAGCGDGTVRQSRSSSCRGRLRPAACWWPNSSAGSAGCWVPTCPPWRASGPTARWWWGRRQVRRSLQALAGPTRSPGRARRAISFAPPASAPMP